MSDGLPSATGFRTGTGPFTRALVLENPDPSLDDHLRAMGITPTRVAEAPSEDELVQQSLLESGASYSSSNSSGSL